MSEPTSVRASRENAAALLQQLRRHALAAQRAAQQVQVSLSRLQAMGFESGRVRSVIDQMMLVRRIALEILKDLEAEPVEAAHE